MTQVFESGGQIIGVSASASVLPTNEYSGLISLRINWLDLLAVQGTPKSLLQHHSSKASILWCSAFFIVQLSHPYMTTGKTIDLTRQTLVSKVVSLLSNMLSRFVIGFSVVLYRCENFIIMKAEHQRIDAFELWCWRRLLRVPWTVRRSNQSVLKEINPKYSQEGLNIHAKAEAPIFWPPDSKN